ncbi:MAG: hypothetical protein LBF24_02375, partial [Puniceicoccales bacterium]|nr:hypothetical protein [Puniceicoccales bacterium]
MLNFIHSQDCVVFGTTETLAVRPSNVIGIDYHLFTFPDTLKLWLPNFQEKIEHIVRNGGELTLITVTDEPDKTKRIRPIDMKLASDCFLIYNSIYDSIRGKIDSEYAVHLFTQYNKCVAIRMRNYQALYDLQIPPKNAEAWERKKEEIFRQLNGRVLWSEEASSIIFPEIEQFFSELPREGDGSADSDFDSFDAPTKPSTEEPGRLEPPAETATDWADIGELAASVFYF